MAYDQGTDTQSQQSRLEAVRNAFALKMAALHDLSVELSLANDVDELSRRAVELGHRILGFDRVGIWFVDPANNNMFIGSFGTDEAGKIRDERGIQFNRSETGLPENFYQGKEPVSYLGLGPCLNDKQEEVGQAERAMALVWDGRKVIGEISVDNLITKRRIDGGSLELLVRFARIVGYLTSLKRAQAELKQLSCTDELTGVVNRRTVLIVLEKQFSLAERKGESLSVLFCDLDGLKSINDQKGHQAGDEYIIEAATLLMHSVRESDTVGRIGGDEFLIVLPDCDSVGAAIIDARIEANLGKKNAEDPSRISIYISRGLASIGELEGAKLPRTPQALIDLSDRRMYEAKLARREGRRE